ncbi:MAG: T9SS type A sorting domain-containing protein [Calditrichaeota bacterium]|nr:T9SS type A sorting domain-containing protein [Calditrichota bacterium]
MRTFVIIIFALSLTLFSVCFAQPNISVSHLELEFGEVGIGHTAAKIIRVKNTGDEDLVIQSFDIPGEIFQHDQPDELVLEPGQFHRVSVRFSPMEAGVFGEIISINNNVQDLEVSMLGTGRDPDDTVELSYDSGRTDRSFQNLGDGNMEGVCFTPAHPCSLVSISIRVLGEGELELHVWGDNGAHEPDQTNDITDPIIVDVQDDGDWVEVDVSGMNLVFDPPEDFHIGHANRDGGPQFWLDDSENGYQQRGHLWTFNQGLNQDLWHTLPGNYVVRVNVKYFDERHNYTFRKVNVEAGVGGLSKTAWGDYDNDGWEDMLQGGRTLYRKLGDGTFENVSQAAGIVADNPSHTGTWGDFDNDGWLDFMALTSGAAEDRLYRNNADGTFEMVNDQYEFHHGDNPTAAVGWGDANNDGFLDFHIANSEHWNDGNPEYFRDYLYNYDPEWGLFLEMTPSDIGRARYYGRSVAWCDFDMDGDMDYYLSNYRLHPNFLMVNMGEFQFDDEAERHGVRGGNRRGSFGHTIGSAWSDFDNDGDFDLLVGNFAHPWGLDYQDKIWFCRSSGHPNYNFEEIREGAGIEYCETVFCPAFGDFDNDGWQDLFISSVYDGRQPFMYRATGDGVSFENVNYETGFHGIAYNSNGVTWCDYDHDGDLDIAIGNGGLFENTSKEGIWTEVVLRGSSDTVNKFAFGSQVSVHVGDMHYLRQVEGGSGSESCQNSMTQHFGLGGAERIDSLVVNWMGGDTDRYFDLPVNQRWIVNEGEELMVAPMKPGESVMPSNFVLATPFPNPFNSQVNLSFTLHKSDNIRIEVYDMVGRKVSTLTNTTYTVGEHNISWNAKGVPSGIYIIQAHHRGGISNRQVSLVR